jgi:hypothetical protein
MSSVTDVCVLIALAFIIYRLTILEESIPLKEPPPPPPMPPLPQSQPQPHALPPSEVVDLRVSCIELAEAAQPHVENHEMLMQLAAHNPGMTIACSDPERKLSVFDTVDGRCEKPWPAHPQNVVFNIDPQTNTLSYDCVMPDTSAILRISTAVVVD